MSYFNYLLRNLKWLVVFSLFTSLLGSCQSNPPQADNNLAPESSSVDTENKGIGITAVALPTEHSKIALVTGNDNYEYSALTNPVNDARQVAEALGKIGFHVQLKINLTHQQMDEALDKFYETLRDKPNSVGLFYFAGHGAQLNNENYLIPIDNGKISKPRDLEYNAVGLNRIQGDMDNAKTYLNVLVLDACRNDPYRSTERGLTRGLSQVNNTDSGRDKSVGSLIAFSTSSGQVASDDIGYARHFSEMLVKANKIGMRIDDMFRELRNTIKDKSNGSQTPWFNESLAKPVCFDLCKEQQEEREQLAEQQRAQEEKARQEQLAEQQRAQEEKARQERLAGQQRAQEEKARQEQLAGQQRAQEEKARQERLAGQQRLQAEREQQRREEEQLKPTVPSTDKLDCKQLFAQWERGVEPLTKKEENFLKNQCNYSPK